MVRTSAALRELGWKLITFNHLFDSAAQETNQELLNVFHNPMKFLTGIRNYNQPQAV